MRLAPSLSLAALAVVIATPLRASANPKAEAKAHFDKASELFKNEKFVEALDELKTAYTLDPRPELLYAIGQAHAHLGQCEQAKTYYEQFIATKPKAGGASAARDAITACKPVEPTPEPPPEPPPAPPPPPPPKPEPKPVPVVVPVVSSAPWYADYLGDALVGAGLVSGVAGLVEYRAAQNDHDQAAKSTNLQTFRDLLASSSSKRTTSLVLDVASAALIVGGAAHLAFHHPAVEQVHVVPLTGGGAVTWGGRF